MYNRPNSLDFMKALDMLMPYKEKLNEIHKAYKCSKKPRKNSSNIIEVNVSTSSSTYDNNTIEAIVNELKQKISHLDIYDYEYETFLDGILKHREINSYLFDGYSDLKEVYFYLIHIFHDKNQQNIINHILKGTILRIIECLFIRI